MWKSGRRSHDANLAQIHREKEQAKAIQTQIKFGLQSLHQKQWSLILCPFHLKSLLCFYWLCAAGLTEAKEAPPKKKTTMRMEKDKTVNMHHMKTVLPSRVALLRQWKVLGGAADAEGGGEKRRNVWDDCHQRAWRRALIRRSHGNDDIVLVPHVEGIWVWVAQSRWHVQRTDSFYGGVFFQVLIDWAQQTVCAPVKEESPPLH